MPGMNACRTSICCTAVFDMSSNRPEYGYNPKNDSFHDLHYRHGISFQILVDHIVRMIGR